MNQTDTEVTKRSPRVAAMIQELERFAAHGISVQERAKPVGLVLTTVIGSRANPPWSQVARALRALEPGTDRYCILDDRKGSYIQTLCGVNGYHVECHDAGAPQGLNLRASYPGGSAEPQKLRTLTYSNDGQARDLLQLEDVVEAFSGYYQGSNLTWLAWRDFHWE